MTRLGRREWVGLGVLVLTVVVWVAGRRGNGEGLAGGTPPGVRNPGGGRIEVPTPVVDVHLELLDGRREEARETRRDLFRFRDRPQMAVPGTVSPQPTGRGTVPQPIAVGPPPPPTIPLRFIGVLEAPGQVGGRVAVLSDGRGNVFYGKEGDIVEGRYRMLQIGPETAEMAYADGRGRQTIRLTGQ